MGSCFFLDHQYCLFFIDLQLLYALYNFESSIFFYQKPRSRRGRVVWQLALQISNYLCNRYILPLTLRARIPLMWGVFDTIYLLCLVDVGTSFSSSVKSSLGLVLYCYFNMPTINKTYVLADLFFYSYDFMQGFLNKNRKEASPIL